ncbi:fasciclin domain-containing protein [Salininema proteolyticum]|uniref:Fasciclin domain-containing protein n=1 Tax=Salininema proteolyticum TaxID=1607685 RepID=A0ABV8U397_9ACTN
MATTFRARMAGALLAASALFATTACSDDGDDKTEEESSEEMTDQQPAPESEESTDTAADDVFGTACSAVPEDGSGSFEGMAQDPVATAASNNPALSTLVTAVGEAGLGDTLNSAEDITVFAPANDAFEKIPEEDLNAVLADKDKLTEILTYHVVGERVDAGELGEGSPYTTLQGGTIDVSGSGEDFTVNGDAAVVCGNVQTSNATVYIIDTVLMP